MARTFVDRGGTFTDVVSFGDDGSVTWRKVRSDRAVVGELARGELVFGTTVATNALLEGAGAPTVLVVTEGFADLLRIGDMSRPELFDPEATWPVARCLRVVEVRGRLAADGTELVPLDADAPLDLTGAEAVAVALLHAHRDPRHELQLADRIRRDHPGLFVALGHQASPELGYLARIETTLVDASITPTLRAALDRDRIPGSARAIRSDGGLCPAHALRAPDAVLSGPAGGVLGVAAVAAQAGFARAVGLDMGGTSTDVCRVEAGKLPRREGDLRVGGARIRRPALEVETIAAGGGSVLRSDGIALTVGPDSAGAAPGPQCWGAGGPPTVTDAALRCGLVDPAAFDPPLDPSLVALPGPAEAFLDVARDQMAAAIRRLATQRGIDLSDHALVAFGGAAGAHACAVAERVGIATVLVHPCAAVLSAWGQSLARDEAAGVRAVWRPLTEAWDEIGAAWAAIEGELPPLGHVSRTMELRHRGTDHAIEIEASTADAALLGFLAEHRRRYGFDREGVVEVVNARVRVRSSAPEVRPVDPEGFGLDQPVAGPVTLHLPTTSIHVASGWSARVDRGLLRLDRGDQPPAAPPLDRTPHGVALWGNRFMAVAEQAGTTLQRLARSVNIRERLDFSCALFDGDGRLVANAPHIPVHLGAMGVTVRDLIASGVALTPGQAWLCNDPAAGGSHLPDLTVITAIELGGHRFFAASRAHHVDVGGSTPGSMPPHSARLDEEGFVARHVPLLRDGRLRDLDDVLVGCRQPDVVRADLEAQIAANHHAARELAALGPADSVRTWMGHLLDAAHEAVAEVIHALPTPSPVVEDAIGGARLRLQLRVDAGRLHVDFSGTEGPHPGNLNAPEAVVRAAVLYALRVLVGRPIPLNEGALRDVVFHLPRPSIVAPPPGAAVAGGNVETSQRLVDLVLRATGRMASSGGTMNNLTLGGDGWSLYETIGVGQGGSPRGAGPEGRQVHMTNTRATDPEVLETRLPLRLWRFSLRPGSGGRGRHPGGEGLIREVEVLVPATAALLATRRDQGAPGEAGGEPGAPRRDHARGAPWDGSPIRLEPGDRVVVETPGGGGWGPAVD